MAWTEGRGFCVETADNTTSTLANHPDGIFVKTILLSNTGATNRDMTLSSAGNVIWDSRVAAQVAIVIPIYTLLDDITIGGTGSSDVIVTVFYK